MVGDLVNREQMIEKATKVIYDESGSVTESDSYDIACTVLDAILPQVATVAELEALPYGSVVLDGEFGVAYELTSSGWCSPGDKQVENLDADDLPLTVVYQPEDAS